MDIVFLLSSCPTHHSHRHLALLIPPEGNNNGFLAKPVAMVAAVGWDVSRLSRRAGVYTRRGETCRQGRESARDEGAACHEVAHAPLALTMVNACHL